ncbi:MAG: oxidoreductase [Bacteroidales bacterium]|nr:oxidoreductase [Bacteroidales bacterium]
MSKFTEVTIVNKIQIANKVFVIEIKREFSFKPGQIIGITMSPKQNPRLYSICSGNNEHNISILFNIKDDGELTPPLAAANIGDKIWITKVQGKFIFNNKPSWWIATGTGIAPFYSMFKSGQQPLKLIQGGRLKTDMYFSNVFKELSNYVRCCSQDKGDDIFEGRLTKYIGDLNNIPTNIDYYLCGSTDMVVDIRKLLIKKGVGFNNIITEIYF